MSAGPVTGSITGLLVPVPEAEPVVAGHRLRLDANAAAGVPAHVTVLFPFGPMTSGELARLGEIFAGLPAFDYEFDRTAWFDTEVLWLAPVDPEPFRRLTARVFEAFPQYPPSEGRFTDVVPHLTIGHARPLDELRAAERAVRSQLPIRGRATRVDLIEIVDGEGWRWRHRETFELSGASPAPA